MSFFRTVWQTALESQSPSKGVHFVNELGNRIRLAVSVRPIDGVRSTTKEAVKGAPGIFIELEGPTSLSENHITRMEAEKLYEELGKALHQR